jgi:hypothetical protein
MINSLRGIKRNLTAKAQKAKKVYQALCRGWRAAGEAGRKKYRLKLPFSPYAPLR